jgi:hypothetical protein
MITKYFNPDIEDICIGYELEMNWNRAYEEKWVPIKISVQDEEFAYTSKLSEIVDALHDGMSEARVPYLTKEQIEAEGWYKIDDNYPIQTFKSLIEVSVEVIYNYDTHYLFITIPGKIMFVEPKINYRANKFSGKCKDVNTFRKICKLLEI